MSDNDRPLPMPPKTPFGRRNRYDEREEDTPLMADQMAAAMAEGKLGDFLDREMKDNEYAKNLAMMMMGMTGMMPPQERVSTPASPAVPQPPEDVVHAAKSGDVGEMMNLLQREYRKIQPEATPSHSDAAQTEEDSQGPASAIAPEEKELVDGLLDIARKNRLTLDWLVLRALKLYVEEYQKSGRL